MESRIDVHSHFLPKPYMELLNRHGLKTLDGGMPIPFWSEEQHLKDMETMNISVSLLSISSPHIHFGGSSEAAEASRACNSAGIELCRRNPDKLRLLAVLPLPDIAETLNEIRYCGDIPEICGYAVKTNNNGVYLGDYRLNPVMEELNRRKAVLVLHPVEPTHINTEVCAGLPYPLMEFVFDTTRAVANLIMNKIPQRFQDIKFVIPHSGSALGILADRLASYTQFISTPWGEPDVTGSLSSFYYDLSGLSVSKQLQPLLQITDYNHILYGADAPFTPLPLRQSLEEAMDAVFTPEQRKLIYRVNPKKLFGL